MGCRVRCVMAAFSIIEGIIDVENIYLYQKNRQKIY